MTADALSRAISGQRGFGLGEISALAEALKADLHYLITGERDPFMRGVTARHLTDTATWERSVPDEETNSEQLENIALLYRQAGEEVIEPTPALPETAAELRELLGAGFVHDFADAIERIGVDFVRIQELTSPFKFEALGRSVVAVPAHGNWFNTNFSIAHELGHISLGLSTLDSDSEAAVNRFAGELLMPEGEMSSYDWSVASAADVARLIWDAGVSTHAVSTRLKKLGIVPGDAASKALSVSTQALLRRTGTPGNDSADRDAITERMNRASGRRFPGYLETALRERVAEGKAPVASLAWALGVPAETLEVETPAGPRRLSSSELLELIG